MSEGKSPLIRVSLSNFLNLNFGAALVLTTFFMPWFVNIRVFEVHRYMFRALQTGEKTDLVLAALLLVSMNSIRSVPHYVGVFFIGESVEFSYKGRKLWLLNALLMFVMLRVIYGSFNVLWGIRYDFGLPTVLIFLFEGLFQSLNYKYISRAKKTMLLTLTLTTFQFMDIMPVMSILPVGRGEVSQEIKLSAEVLEAETLLDLTGLVGMLLFFLFSLLIFLLLREENVLREMNALKEQNQEIRLQMQVSEIKNRTYQEMQYLVHDLKSPLTTAQTLAGLLKMESEAEGRSADVGYLSRIESAIDRMSGMISEILYEDKLSAFTTDEIMEVVLAQASVTEYAGCIHSENRAAGKVLLANKMLFSRALTNLLQNSAKAAANQRNPKIELLVDCADGLIRFTVSDNGRGIDAQMHTQVFERGVSGEASSGLGLAFVRNIVDAMGGEIKVTSIPNRKTSITIIIPQEDIT